MPEVYMGLTLAAVVAMGIFVYVVWKISHEIWDFCQPHARCNPHSTRRVAALLRTQLRSCLQKLVICSQLSALSPARASFFFTPISSR